MNWLWTALKASLCMDGHPVVDDTAPLLRLDEDGLWVDEHGEPWA